MESSVLQIACIFAAGFLAGMINSVAGGGTLISFPVLVWLGRDALLANATNAVALWPGSLAGMFGFRHDITESRRWMWLLGLPSIIGALLGAVLLLLTPTKIFSALVPYLILFATLLFAFGEPISKRLRVLTADDDAAPTRDAPTLRAWVVGAMGFQFLVATYGGYFGAGMGILMLAALGLMGLSDIHQMNGLKNFFAFVINGVASVYFIASGKVYWSDALVMAVGAMAGGYGGAGLARRLGRSFVRRLVIIIGLAMAISLLFRR